MPFSEEEKAQWLAQKRKREQRQDVEIALPVVGTCPHCGCAITYANGTLFDGFELCDACDGD